jgi:hypothetical protein
VLPDPSRRRSDGRLSAVASVVAIQRELLKIVERLGRVVIFLFKRGWPKHRRHPFEHVAVSSSAGR